MKDVVDQPNYQKIILPQHKGKDLRSAIPKASLAAVDLLSGLLAYDPKKRLTAYEALQHPYFQVGIFGTLSKFLSCVLRLRLNGESVICITNDSCTPQI